MATSTASSGKEIETDVLVIGAGPAGLLLSLQLSILQIPTLVIDKAPHPVQVGHADGFQCRTIEVFEALGRAGGANAGERVRREGNEIAEVTFWNPDPQTGRDLVRTERIPDTEPGTSRFRHVVLSQARVERILLDGMWEADHLEVNRLLKPTSMTLPVPFSQEVPSDKTKSNDGHTHGYLSYLDQNPVTVTLARIPSPSVSSNPEKSDTNTNDDKIQSGLYRSNLFLQEQEAQERREEEERRSRAQKSLDGDEIKVKAKFVVGCDGARSWVRRELGFKLEGDSSNTYWGVLDGIPVTDFPDIRLKPVVHSALAGSIIIIPRERNLVRLYIQLGTVKEGERLDRSLISVDKILETAKIIMQPFKLELHDIEWWTVYEIGQRLCSEWTKDERVFLSGDSVHTHSPKAGQGMNVSMMDSFNLAWKLAQVLKGISNPEILATYQSERLSNAMDLLDFDRKLVPLISGKPRVREDAGISLEEFGRLWRDSIKFTSGTAVVYAPSLLVDKPLLESNTEGQRKGWISPLASNLLVGSHLESRLVVSLADVHSWHLVDRFYADGKWRLLIFAGNILKPSQRTIFDDLCNHLDSDSGPIRRFTPSLGRGKKPGEELNSIIEILTLISPVCDRTQIELNNLPEVLTPRTGEWGYKAYDTVFIDAPSYHDSHGRCYEYYGVNQDKGCMVVVRPDQHVSAVLGLENHDDLERFFEKILTSPSVT